jgi:excisionase family DNA binding protein
MNGFDMLLSVQQVATRLRISRGSVYELVKRGDLAVHRVGSGRGTIRISEADLQAYLSRCRSGGGEEREQVATVPSRRALKHIKVGGR